MGYGYIFYLYLDSPDFIPTDTQIIGIFEIFKKFNVTPARLDESVIISALKRREGNVGDEILFEHVYPIRKDFFTKFMGIDARLLGSSQNGDPHEINVSMIILKEPIQHPLTGDDAFPSRFILMQLYLGKSYLWDDFAAEDADEKINDPNIEMEQDGDKMERFSDEFDRVHSKLVSELSNYLNHDIRTCFDYGW